MRTEIKGADHPIAKVFSDDFFLRIPDYQRPYAWTQENAEELLSDLLTFMGSDTGPLERVRPYFLGSIVLVKQHDAPEADVIDGQQRLISLTILLAVLRAAINSPFGNSLTRFLNQVGCPVLSTQDRFRLVPRDQDVAFFRDYVQEPDGLLKLSKLTHELSDSQKRIRENADLFQREVAKLSPPSRERLASYIVQRCYLVVVSTPDPESAYRIFSVLNNRGLDLSHADILKAEIVGRIEGKEPQHDYAKKWEDAEESIGTEAFKHLFGHLRMIQTRAKLEGTVLAEFRKAVLDATPDAKAIIDNIVVPGARAYDQIRRCSWEGDSDDKTQLQIVRTLGWLNRLDNVDWVPAVILLLQTTSEATAVRDSLAAIERLAAFLLVRRANVNDRIRRYAKVLNAIVHGNPLSEESPLRLTSDEQQQFLTVLDGEVYLEPKIRVYVLLRLDQALGDGSAEYHNTSTITVEHVLPQNPREMSTWLVDFPTPLERSWTHRLGNLLLLPRRKNSEASNWDFEKKKQRYFTSSKGVSTFALTSQVLKETVWTPSVVARRQVELLQVLAKCWSLSATPAPTPPTP